MIRGERAIRWTAGLYALAWAVHTGDHLRRGLDVVTVEVAVLGSAAALLQLGAIGAVFARLKWAPIAAAAVGLPDAVGIAAVHLLPHWSAFSDSFPDATGLHRGEVSGFSWFAAILEILAALAFGLAGLAEWRRLAGRGSPARLAG